MIDLAKLSPAPWRPDGADDFGDGWCHTVVNDELLLIQIENYRNNQKDPIAKAAADFIAMARNAFDVMMRRGWFPCLGRDKEWTVRKNASFESPYDDGKPRMKSSEQPVFKDPFTALVEADKWYKEHVEK